MNNNEPLGKVAYNAYLFASDGKSLVTGVQLPDWEQLRPTIQHAWNCAALAVQCRCIELTNEKPDVD